MTALIRGALVPGRGQATKHIGATLDELQVVTDMRMFPGSLNLLLERPVAFAVDKAIRFDGAERLLWPARIGSEKVWIYRWRHAPLHVAEILAPVKLRERFELTDSSLVDLEVETELLDPVPYWSWALCWKGREHLAYRNDAYNRGIGILARNTGFGIASFKQLIPTTVRSVLRRALARSPRPYPFARLDTGALDGQERELKQVTNLLNYTKTSNTTYAAQQFPAGYHSINLGGRFLAGQRDPGARLKSVPIDFADKSVVDLGSNQGGMLLQLSDRLKWGVGVDYDHRMVNAANRIRTVTGASQLNFYVFDLQRENLQIIRDYLPDEKVDVCFLLSVCMWLTNWRDVIDFATSIADAVLFESNGTEQQQKDQIDYLHLVRPNTIMLAGNSPDDPGQKNRKLLLARR